MAAIFFVVAVPMAGLAIDLGSFYLIQTRLQSATDAAALAGARALARGLNGFAQQTAAQNTATAYFNANFPSGFMGVTGITVPTPLVDASVLNQRSVEITASVDAPQIFLRWFGGTFSTIRANAKATRRDVNVVIVMDRSGSLASSGSCAPLKAAAQDFVGKFAEGRDNIGLVTFATNSRADFPAANNFRTAAPDINSIISNVSCAGWTNSSLGLWNGYLDLARLAQPAALNVILFFTDGDPTAVTSKVQIAGGSPCASHADKIGVFKAQAGGGRPRGLFDYLAPPQPTPSDAPVIANSVGCWFAMDQSRVADDISSLPSSDAFGNNMANGYLPVALSGGAFDPYNQSNLYNGLINAADDAAFRIRSGAVPGGGLTPIPGVMIFSIGLGMSSPASSEFLRRVSNDQASPVWSSSTTTGMFIQANNASELQNAFRRVASEVLRLAQ